MCKLYRRHTTHFGHHQRRLTANSADTSSCQLRLTKTIYNFPLVAKLFCESLAALCTHAYNESTYGDSKHCAGKSRNKCQPPSKRRTDGRTKRRVSSSVRPFIRPFVCLFVRCVCQGRPSYGGTNRSAS